MLGILFFFSLECYASLNPLSRNFLKIVLGSLLTLGSFSVYIIAGLCCLVYQTDCVDFLNAVNLMALSRTEVWSSVHDDALDT